jgi:hypothetical protein
LHSDSAYADTVASAVAQLESTNVLRARPRAIRTWKAFVRFAETSKMKMGFSFRGQRQWEWPLASSLERCAVDNGIPLYELYSEGVEQGIIRRFKRQYHLFSGAAPNDQDHIEWLSLMQHHGAPTRMVDITYSAYVGLFFALEGYQVGERAALWCFNKEWLDLGYDARASESYHHEYACDPDGRWLSLFELVLEETATKVYALNPYRMPERLTAQQGGFILPIDVKQPFMSNLAEMPRVPEWNGRKPACGVAILKIGLRFDKVQLDEVRRGLNTMNINSGTLFPGLDGHARSLRDRISLPEQRYSYRKGFGRSDGRLT